MKYVFTLVLPFLMAITALYFLGFLSWSSALAAVFCVFIVDYLYKEYFKEEWDDPYGWYDDKPTGYLNLLRQIQYQRLSTTPEVRAMQRLANLPGIDISSSVDFANGLLSAEINRDIVYALRQIVAMGRADTEDLHRLRTLTPERFYWLKDNFPSLMSEIEGLGLIPYLQDMAFGPIPNRADVSEAVASGEIKSTGQSVSVDEVIADIDAHLKGESNL